MLESLALGSREAPVRALRRRDRIRHVLTVALHVLAMAALTAGIVHIASVLLLPSQAPSDAWARIEASTELNQPVLVSRAWNDANASPLASAMRADPITSIALCRFDLSQAPVLVTAEGSVPLWTLSVFDTEGVARFSLNDRTAVERQVEVVVRNPLQLARMRETPVVGLENAIIVDVPGDRGFILLRAYAPSRADAAATVALLQGMSCGPLEISAG